MSVSSQLRAVLAPVQRLALKTLVLFIALLPVSGAYANDKLDCLGNIFNLGLDSRFSINVATDPTQELLIRKSLAIRAWVAYWNYDIGSYDKAQFAIASYSTLLSQLQTDGLVDLSAQGQPDIATSLVAADACVNNPLPSLATGLQTMQSNSVEREFYLQLPSGYGDGSAKPLVFAYHGYTGSYLNWVGESPYYDFLEVVGDDAIFVVPQALENAQGQTNWGGEDDINYFLDMISELELNGLVYDPNRLFVVGHSNGAGFTHDLGCEYGDIIRGIAVAAGALTNTDCIGSIAALLMQGNNDPLTDSGLALSSLRYWVLYNGWEEGVFGASTSGPVCDDYSVTNPLKPANIPYPVLWCEHTQGHSWPDYGSQTVWDFFTGLPEALPTANAPPGGGNDVATVPSTANLILNLSIPADVNQPLRAVGTLRAVSYMTAPTCSAPDVVITAIFPVDEIMMPGEETGLLTVPINVSLGGGSLTNGSDWTLSFAVYVEGGSNSIIPTPFVDQEMKMLVTYVDEFTDIVIPGVPALTPVGDLCSYP
jgi:polyhydroxybutyrate depolymerase